MKGDIETVTMLAVMVVGFILVVLAFYFYLKPIGEGMKENPVLTGCKGDDSLCSSNPKGEVCIETSKNNYECGCITDNDCVSGICKKELGSNYGKCG